MMNVIKTPLRLLRWRLRRARKRAGYHRLDAPCFFANSFPKSGTHLLTQVMEGFGQLGPVVNTGLPAIVNFEGETGVPIPVEKLTRKLNRLRPGDIGYGHLHAYPEVQEILCAPGWVTFFIYRDPRDVVISHVHYITDMAPDHVHNAYYKNKLHSFEERLQVSIMGRPELEIPFPGIQERFAPYLPWLSLPEVLPLRFEDFITAPRKTLARVLDFAIERGFAYQGERELAVDVLQAAIDPQRSPTFRSGKVGGWVQRFDSQNKTLFKEQAGELLIQLGYEKDLDW
jgi:hypothetical protein